ncbi:MAG: hypothetical protein ACT4R6_10800 [Gemmatimonadaceae bacterium]
MKPRPFAAAALLMACYNGSPSSVSPNDFADGLVAFVQDVNDRAWPHDTLTIESATVSADTLAVTVRFGGGCRKHRFALLLGTAFMESHPVQIQARLAHDAAGDLCRALITESLKFDLTRLKQRYRASYGSGAAAVIMNLVGHGRSVRYSFP